MSKKSTGVKRTSSIHEEKKMIPNESSKQIITASGGVRFDLVKMISICVLEAMIW